MTEAEPLLGLADVQQFAVAGVGSRLASDANLVARFWTRVATSVRASEPDLTIFYTLVRQAGQVFALVEFVAGETLEDLVKRSDPAACEREIPLFCRLLDAFEEGAQRAKEIETAAASLELIDFGIRRLGASRIGKLHGAMLLGTGGIRHEAFVGGSDQDRWQIRVQCSALYATLTGEACPSSAPQSIPAGLLGKLENRPLAIAAGTALLVLLTLSGVGGFLARRTIPANAGALVLPPLPAAPVEAPVESPAPLAADPVPELEAPHPVLHKGAARAPNATIVLARGARPIRQTQLQYPEAARKERVSGVVELQLTIAEDGSVQNPRVVSGDPLLRAGLAEEVSKWIYAPMRVNGKPAPMTTELAIRFNLSP